MKTSIESLVGPPTLVIPLANYADGTYSYEDTATGLIVNGAAQGLVGTAADVSDYRGAIIQVVVGRCSGANANALKIIPHHGCCPEFVTHDPFGADWGFYFNGKSNASAGTTEVRNVFIDTQFCNAYLSVEATVASGSGAIFGVTVIPVDPKTSPRTGDFDAGTLLSVIDSGPLNLEG